MIVAAAILATLTISPRLPELPAWVDLTLKPTNDKYQKILDEVRPLYGEDGLIDSRRVREEFESAASAFLKTPENPELLMRAMALREVLRSDPFNPPRDHWSEEGRSFVAMSSFLNTRVDSFAYVRTKVLAKFGEDDDEAFTRFEVLPQLYRAAPHDTELELAYLYWAASTDFTDREVLIQLAKKQEALPFRRIARKRDLVYVYQSLAHRPPRRRDLLDKSFSLLVEYQEALPEGHPNNTDERRKWAAEWMKSTYDRWASWEGR